MPTFGFIEDSEELGGLSTELVGMTVAYQFLGEYLQDSKFVAGKKENVVRTRAFTAAADGSLQDLGIRLIFWPVAQRQLKEQWATADLAVGVLREKPQSADPSKTFYGLEAAEQADRKRLAEAFASSSNAPF